MDEKITKVNILKKEIMKTEKVVNETSKCITFYKCVPCFELFEYTTRKVKFKNLKWSRQTPRKHNLQSWFKNT